MNTQLKKVMVIGGGIAGLTAAWELSKSDIEVDLVEKTDFLGGNAIQYSCKATDECRQCNACTVEKMLKNVVNEPKIKVHLAAEIETVSKNGNYEVTLNKKPQYLDPAKDIDFAALHETCPVEGAVLRGCSKNNVPLYALDGDKIPDVKDWLKGNYPQVAGDLDKSALQKQLAVDAIILASGFQPFNPEEKPTYGYGRFNNVVTGLELDRILRGKGSIQRPSDGAVPEKIAYIQCVGSRDERLGHLWCSHVCCPYALRGAEVMKYKNSDLDITVFYMDIQNTDKNFPIFYETCKTDLRFVRNIPVDIYPLEGDRLKMRYMGEDGAPIDEEFDLVVLSVGIMPGPDNGKLSEALGIDLDQDGFLLSTDKLNRTSTAKDGVFVAGTVEGPKTIAASMAHAGQAACEVMKYLGGAK